MTAVAAAPRTPPLLTWLGRAAIAGLLLLILVFPVISMDRYYHTIIILSLLLAINASSWNIISGFAGYVSLGQTVFLGIGAYTTALLSLRVFGSDEFGGAQANPFYFVPISAIVAGLFAAAVGPIIMRTRGHSFVILTIAFLFVMQLVVLNWTELTYGNRGLSLPLPTWPREWQNLPFYYVFFGLLLLTIATAWWIRRTKFGMGLIAIREDEDKAAAVGVNTPIYKMLAYIASAVWIGAAGGVYAYFLSFIDPRNMFDIVPSVFVVLAVLLGGRGTIWGPVIGAFILEPLNQITNNNFNDWVPGSIWDSNVRLIFFGALLALVIMFLPRGVIPSVGDIMRKRRMATAVAQVGQRFERKPMRVVERAAEEAKEAPSGPLLEVKNVQKRFGGVKAVDGVTLAVERGSISALIGPNGSGKTTLFNLIDGTMPADGGEIWFDGERIDRLPPYRRAHRGIGRTFQITRLFRQMTVLENVVAPLRSFSWRGLGADAVSGPEAERAVELLEFVGMHRYAEHRAGELSYGQGKLVELAQILMLDPKLIMLDEPAGGINPTLIAHMEEMIRELNRQGTTFLIVEHNMPLVLGLCDPVCVLARGQTICQGTPAQVQADPAVLDAYLGEDFALEEPAGVT